MSATIYGQTREQWTLQAAKAIQASGDPSLIAQILSGGFRAFAALARREFRREAPGIVFTTAELRVMYEHLLQSYPARRGWYGPS